MVETARTGRPAARRSARDVRWHPSALDRDERWEQLGQRGATVWLTGLPASGKSTIAVALEHALVDAGRFAYLLDGDNIRHGLSGDLGFDPASRSENIRRVAHVARLFADAGAVAVVSLVSPFREDRDAARALHDEAGLPFVEVFVDTPVEECARRDPKGLYARARAGRLTGLTGAGALVRAARGRRDRDPPGAGRGLRAATAGGDRMITLEGGEFLMGNDGPDAIPGDGEGPVREVVAEPFAIEPVHGHRAPLRALRRGDGPRHRRRARGLVVRLRRPAARRLPADPRAGRRAVVAAGLRRELARAGRTGLGGAARPSGRARVLQRRAGVLRLGRRRGSRPSASGSTPPAAG